MAGFCIVSDYAAVSGGAAKVAVDSARGLAEAGHRVLFVHALDPVAEKLRHPNITVERLAFPNVWDVGSRAKAAVQGVWNAAAGRALAALLTREAGRIDIVHFHQWTKAFSPSVIAAAGHAGLPVAVTIHDYFAFCPEGIYYDFQHGAACALQPMSLACVTRHCDRDSPAHKAVRVARVVATKRAFARCRDLTFVHVSDVARRFAQPNLPVHARHVTIENVVEVERGPPADVAANRHALFVGRLTPEKGPDQLAAAGREVGMPTRFVGEGPARAAIQAADGQAEITGWVEPSRVAEIVAASRCLVAASLWPETGPLTVYEAMARGVPPVVSAHLGAASRVTDGVDGLVVPAGDPASLAGALRRLLDAEVARRLGLAAHAAYWRDPLTIDRHVAGLAALVAGKGASRAAA